MPLLLFRVNRVLCWGSADQRMDFTTMDYAAAFTASVALDPSTPRFLRIAGSQVSARELALIASEVTGKPFRLLRPGGLGMLGALIEIARLAAPKRPNSTLPGRACSTCAICSTVGQSSGRWTTSAILECAGRPCEK